MFLAEVPEACPQDVPRLALHIRRQLEIHCTKLAVSFKRNVETLITDEIESEQESDSEDSLAFAELPFNN